MISAMGPERQASWTSPDGQSHTCRLLDRVDLETQAASWVQQCGGRMTCMVDDDAIFLDEEGTGRNVRIFPRDISNCEQSLQARLRTYFGDHATIRQIEPGMDICSTNPACGGPTNLGGHTCVSTGGLMGGTIGPASSDATSSYKTVIARPQEFTCGFESQPNCTHLEVVWSQ